MFKSRKGDVSHATTVASLFLNHMLKDYKHKPCTNCGKPIPTIRRGKYCKKSCMIAFGNKIKREKRLASGKPLVWRGVRRLGL